MKTLTFIELEVGDKVKVLDCEEAENETYIKLVGCVGTITKIAVGTIPWMPYGVMTIAYDGSLHKTHSIPYFVSFPTEVMDEREIYTSDWTYLLKEGSATEVTEIIYGFYFNPDELEFVE